VSELNFWFLGVHINKYTAPAAVLMLLNALTIIGMYTIFDSEIDRNDGPEDDVSPRTRKNSNAVTGLPENLVKMGLVIFMVLNFNARGVLSIFETINTKLYLEATGQSADSNLAAKQSSMYLFYLGLVGLVTYFAIHRLRNKISDVHWVFTGFSMLAIGNVLLSFNSAEIGMVRLTMAEVLIWSIGSPICTAVVVAAFSKILGGRPQGTAMGLLGSSASVSRIVLPLVPALLTSFTPLFIFDAVLCGGSAYIVYWYSNKVRTYRRENPGLTYGEEEV